MPLIEDCIDSLSGAKVFSTLDLKNGFFHVPVAEDSRKYTSFVTPDGQYEFFKSPFGLCNSPTSFLRRMNEAFRGLIKEKVVVTYMDDLIVSGRSEEEAFEKLEKTLKTAQENGFTINWSKCAFLQKEVEFLGHRIENGHVSPSENKVKAVRFFPEPKTKKHVQSFLGLTGYFRKFVRDYAVIARPLSDLLKDGNVFYFGERQCKSFKELKEILCKEPILRIFNPKAETEVHTDASKEGFGAVMLQKEENEKYLRPVHYMSRKTSEAESKYHSYELEILAAVRALQKFRVYLMGLKFKLVTDCAAFQQTLAKKDLIPKIARWALMFEEFDCEVEHRTGERLKHVDALSRFPVCIIEEKLSQIIRNKQDEDVGLRTIRNKLIEGAYGDYMMEGGILKINVGNKKLIVLPVSLEAEIIKAAHENGHFGVRKMEEKLKEEYYIPKLEEKLKRFISCCIPCILAEKKQGKKEGELKPIPKGETPLDTYHIDHLGPMTATSKMYKHLLVVVDGFTKFVWLYPTKTLTSSEVLNKLTLQQQTFGNPRRIVTDRGTAFTAQDFGRYCEDEGILHSMIAVGVPRGNGQVERIHRIIIPALTKISTAKPDHWYKHVARVQRAINSTYQRSIGMTPFEAMLGIKMKCKEDIQIQEVLEQEAVEMLNEERDELRQKAKEAILKIQEENKRSYNRNTKEARNYIVGETVAIKRTQFGEGSKIKNKYLGPYKVSRVLRNDRYEVIRIGEGDGPHATSTSADMMKPYPHETSETEVGSGMAECREAKTGQKRHLIE